MINYISNDIRFSSVDTVCHHEACPVHQLCARYERYHELVAKEQAFAILNPRFLECSEEAASIASPRRPSAWQGDSSACLTPSHLAIPISSGSAPPIIASPLTAALSVAPSPSPRTCSKSCSSCSRNMVPTSASDLTDMRSKWDMRKSK